MRKFPLWVRGIAASTALIFASTNTVMAGGPQHLYAPKLLSLSEVSLNDSSAIKLSSGVQVPSAIPRSLGKIKKIYQGNSQSLVIHIQDAHVNEEAQRNIAGIIEFFFRGTRTRLVNLEGSTGELVHSLLSRFPDSEARRVVADYFLREGALNGAEYLAVAKRPELVLCGAEDNRIYEENRLAFLKALEHKQRDEEALKEIRELLERVSRHVLSAGLRELYLRKKDFESNGHGWAAYLEYLWDMAGKKEMPGNFPDYPEIRILRDLLEMEKTFRQEDVSLESERLAGELRDRLKDKALRSFLRLSREFQAGTLTSRDYYRALLSASSKMLPGFDPRTSVLTAYVRFLERFESLGNGFFTELKDLEERVKGTLFQNEDERDFDFLFNLLGVYERIFAFSLTPADVDFFTANRALFSAATFRDFLIPQIRRFRFDRTIANDAWAVLDSDLPIVESFYHLALERDSILVEKSIRSMEEHGVEISFLVTGGFHTPGIERFLKDRDISHMVIAPSMNRPIREAEHESRYLNAVRNGASDLMRLFLRSNQEAVSGAGRDPRYQMMPPSKLVSVDAVSRMDLSSAADPLTIVRDYQELDFTVNAALLTAAVSAQRMGKIPSDEISAAVESQLPELSGMAGLIYGPLLGSGAEFLSAGNAGGIRLPLGGLKEALTLTWQPEKSRGEVSLPSRASVRYLIRGKVYGISLADPTEVSLWRAKHVRSVPRAELRTEDESVRLDIESLERLKFDTFQQMSEREQQTLLESLASRRWTEEGFDRFEEHLIENWKLIIPGRVKDRLQSIITGYSAEYLEKIKKLPDETLVVIQAAGIGERLNKDRDPGDWIDKNTLKLGGVSQLQRQLNSLAALGFKHVMVVHNPRNAALIREDIKGYPEWLHITAVEKAGDWMQTFKSAVEDAVRLDYRKVLMLNGESVVDFEYLARLRYTDRDRVFGFHPYAGTHRIQLDGANRRMLDFAVKDKGKGTSALLTFSAPVEEMQRSFADEGLDLDGYVAKFVRDPMTGGFEIPKRKRGGSDTEIGIPDLNELKDIEKARAYHDQNIEWIGPFPYAEMVHPRRVARAVLISNGLFYGDRDILPDHLHDCNNRGTVWFTADYRYVIKAFVGMNDSRYETSRFSDDRYQGEKRFIRSRIESVTLPELVASDDDLKVLVMNHLTGGSEFANLADMISNLSQETETPEGVGNILKWGDWWMRDLARLQSAPEQPAWQKPYPFEDDIAHTREQIAALAGMNHDMAVWQHGLALFTAYYRQNPSPEVPAQGDWAPLNTIPGETTSYLIDGEFSGRAPREKDLATGLVRMHQMNMETAFIHPNIHLRNHFKEIMQGLLDSYEKHTGYRVKWPALYFYMAQDFMQRAFDQIHFKDDDLSPRQYLELSRRYLELMIRALRSEIRSAEPSRAPPFGVLAGEAFDHAAVFREILDLLRHGRVRESVDQYYHRSPNPNDSLDVFFRLMADREPRVRENAAEALATIGWNLMRGYDRARDYRYLGYHALSPEDLRPDRSTPADWARIDTALMLFDYAKNLHAPGGLAESRPYEEKMKVVMAILRQVRDWMDRGITKKMLRPGKRVLIAGGSGFLGERVLGRLLEETSGDTVLVIGDHNPPPLQDWPRDLQQAYERGRIKYAFMDIRDPVSVDRVFDEYGGFEQAIQLAAMKLPAWSALHPAGTIMTNAALGLYRASAAYGTRLIQISSAMLYKGKEDGTYTEEDRVDPTVDPYAASKYLLEVIPKLMGIKAVSFRMTNLYGRGDGGVVSHFIETLFKGEKPLTVFSDVTLDFLHVDDAADVITAFYHEPEAEGIFNLSTNTGINLYDAASMIRVAVEEETGKKVPERLLGPRPLERGDDRILVNSKLREQIPWTRFRPFQDGAREVVRDEIALVRSKSPDKDKTPVDPEITRDERTKFLTTHFTRASDGVEFESLENLRFNGFKIGALRRDLPGRLYPLENPGGEELYVTAGPSGLQHRSFSRDFRPVILHQIGFSAEHNLTVWSVNPETPRPFGLEAIPDFTRYVEAGRGRWIYLGDTPLEEHKNIPSFDGYWIHRPTQQLFSNEQMARVKLEAMARQRTEELDATFWEDLDRRMAINRLPYFVMERRGQKWSPFFMGLEKRRMIDRAILEIEKKNPLKSAGETHSEIMATLGVQTEWSRLNLNGRRIETVIIPDGEFDAAFRAARDGLNAENLAIGLPAVIFPREWMLAGWIAETGRLYLPESSARALEAMAKTRPDLVNAFVSAASGAGELNGEFWDVFSPLLRQDWKPYFMMEFSSGQWGPFLLDHDKRAVLKLVFGQEGRVLEWPEIRTAYPDLDRILSANPKWQDLEFKGIPVKVMVVPDREYQDRFPGAIQRVNAELEKENLPGVLFPELWILAGFMDNAGRFFMPESSARALAVMAQRHPDFYESFLVALQGRGTLDSGFWSLFASAHAEVTAARSELRAVFEEKPPVLRFFDPSETTFALAVSPRFYDAEGRGRLYFDRVSNELVLDGRALSFTNRDDMAALDDLRLPVAELAGNYEQSHPGEEVLAVLPNGNPAFHKGYPFAEDDRIYYYREEDLGRPQEFLTIGWDDKFSVRTLKFINEQGEKGIFDAAGISLTGEVRRVIPGLPIVRNGAANLAGIADRLDDLRHLLRLPMFEPPSGGRVFHGVSDGMGELYREASRDKVRRAVAGEAVTLELKPLRDSGISDEERERAYAEWGYTNLTGVKGREALEAGEYWIDEDKDQMVIRFLPGIHPHTAFGMMQDNRYFVSISEGKTNFSGASLARLANELVQSGVRDAFLWANGNDAAMQAGREIFSPDKLQAKNASALLIVRKSEAARAELRVQEEPLLAGQTPFERALHEVLARRIETLQDEKDLLQDERLTELFAAQRRLLEPYERALREKLGSHEMVRVLQFNQMGNPERERLDRMVREIVDAFPASRPQIIALQETTERWGQYNTAVEVADALGYGHQEYLYHDHGDFKEGLAILFDPSFQQEDFFYRLIPDPQTKRNILALGVRLRSTVNREALYVFTARLSWQRDGLALRAGQMREINAWIRTIVPAGERVVFAGDFNYAAEDEAARTGNLLEGFRDSFKEVNRLSKGITTARAYRWVKFPGKRPDFIYARALVPVHSRVVLNEKPESDHFGLVSDFLWTDRGEKVSVPEETMLAALDNPDTPFARQKLLEDFQLAIKIGAMTPETAMTALAALIRSSPIETAVFYLAVAEKLKIFTEGGEPLIQALREGMQGRERSELRATEEWDEAANKALLQAITEERAAEREKAVAAVLSSLEPGRFQALDETGKKLVLSAIEKLTYDTDEYDRLEQLLVNNLRRADRPDVREILDRYARKYLDTLSRIPDETLVIIQAAGMSSRLSEESYRDKNTQKFSGVSQLQRHLNVLASLGYRHVLVVHNNKNLEFLRQDVLSGRYPETMAIDYADGTGQGWFENLAKAIDLAKTKGFSRAMMLIGESPVPVEYLARMRFSDRENLFLFYPVEKSFHKVKVRKSGRFESYEVLPDKGDRALVSFSAPVDALRGHWIDPATGRLRRDRNIETYLYSTYSSPASAGFVMHEAADNINTPKDLELLRRQRFHSVEMLGRFTGIQPLHPRRLARAFLIANGWHFGDEDLEHDSLFPVFSYHSTVWPTIDGRFYVKAQIPNSSYYPLPTMFHDAHFVREAWFYETIMAGVPKPQLVAQDRRLGLLMTNNIASRSGGWSLAEELLMHELASRRMLNPNRARRVKYHIRDSMELLAEFQQEAFFQSTHSRDEDWAQTRFHAEKMAELNFDTRLWPGALETVRRYFEREKPKLVLSHGDFGPNNIMIAGENSFLIDGEYAGLPAPKEKDLATSIVRTLQVLDDSLFTTEAVTLMMAAYHQERSKRVPSDGRIDWVLLYFYMAEKFLQSAYDVVYFRQDTLGGRKTLELSRLYLEMMSEALSGPQTDDFAAAARRIYDASRSAVAFANILDHLRFGRIDDRSRFGGYSDSNGISSVMGYFTSSPNRDYIRQILRRLAEDREPAVKENASKTLRLIDDFELQRAEKKPMRSEMRSPERIRDAFSKMTTPEWMRELHRVSREQGPYAADIDNALRNVAFRGEKFYSLLKNLMAGILSLDTGVEEVTEADRPRLDLFVSHTLDVITTALQLRHMVKPASSKSPGRLQDLYWTDVSTDKERAEELIRDLRERVESLVPGNPDKAYELLYLTAMLHDVGKFRLYEIHETVGAEIVRDVDILRPLVDAGRLTVEEAELIRLAIKHHVLLGRLWSGETADDNLRSLFEDEETRAYLAGGGDQVNSERLEKLLNLVYAITTVDTGGALTSRGFLNIPNTEFRRAELADVMQIAGATQGYIPSVVERIEQEAREPRLIRHRLARILGFWDMAVSAQSLESYAARFDEAFDGVRGSQSIAPDTLELINSLFPTEGAKLFNLVMPSLGWIPEGLSREDFLGQFDQGRPFPRNVYEIPANLSLNPTAVKLLALSLKAKSLFGETGGIELISEPIELMKVPEYREALWSLELVMREAYDVRREGEEYFFVDKRGSRVDVLGAKVKILVTEAGDLRISFGKYSPRAELRTEEIQVGPAAAQLIDRVLKIPYQSQWLKPGFQMPEAALISFKEGQFSAGLSVWNERASLPFSNEEIRDFEQGKNLSPVSELEKILPEDVRQIRHTFYDRSSGQIRIFLEITVYSGAVHRFVIEGFSTSAVENFKRLEPALADDLLEPGTVAQASVGNLGDLPGYLSLTPTAEGSWRLFTSVNEAWKDRPYRALVSRKDGRMLPGWIRLLGDVVTNDVREVLFKPADSDEFARLGIDETSFVLSAYALGWGAEPASKLLAESYTPASDLRHVFDFPFDAEKKDFLLYDQLAGSPDKIMRAFAGLPVDYELRDRSGEAVDRMKLETILQKSGYLPQSSEGQVTNPGDYHFSSASRVSMILHPALYPVNTIAVSRDGRNAALVAVSGLSGRSGADYWHVAAWIRDRVRENYGWEPYAVFALDNGMDPSVRIYDEPSGEPLILAEGRERVNAAINFKIRQPGLRSELRYEEIPVGPRAAQVIDRAVRIPYDNQWLKPGKEKPVATLVNLRENYGLDLRTWPQRTPRPFTPEDLRAFETGEGLTPFEEFIMKPDEVSEYRQTYYDRAAEGGLIRIDSVVHDQQGQVHRLRSRHLNANSLAPVKDLAPTLDELRDREQAVLQVSFGNNAELNGYLSLMPLEDGRWRLFAGVNEDWYNRSYRAIIQPKEGSAFPAIIRLAGDLETNQIHQVYFARAGESTEHLLMPQSTRSVMTAYALGWGDEPVEELLAENYRTFSDLRHILDFPFLPSYEYVRIFGIEISNAWVVRFAKGVQNLLLRRLKFAEIGKSPEGFVFIDQVAKRPDVLDKIYKGNAVDYVLRDREGRLIRKDLLKKFFDANTYTPKANPEEVKESGDYFLGKDSVRMVVHPGVYPVNTLAMSRDGKKMAVVSVPGLSGRVGANYWSLFNWAKDQISKRFGWEPFALFALDNGADPSVRMFEGPDQEPQNLVDQGRDRVNSALNIVNRRSELREAAGAVEEMVLEHKLGLNLLREEMAKVDLAVADVIDSIFERELGSPSTAANDGNSLFVMPVRHAADVKTAGRILAKYPRTRIAVQVSAGMKEFVEAWRSSLESSQSSRIGVYEDAVDMPLEIRETFGTLQSVDHVTEVFLDADLIRDLTDEERQRINVSAAEYLKPGQVILFNLEVQVAVAASRKSVIRLTLEDLRKEFERMRQFAVSA